MLTCRNETLLYTRCGQCVVGFASHTIRSGRITSVTGLRVTIVLAGLNRVIVCHRASAQLREWLSVTDCRGRKYLGTGLGWHKTPNDKCVAFL